MQRTSLVTLGLLTALVATVGCGDDKGTSTDASTANTSTDTEDATATATMPTGTTDDMTAGTASTEDTTEGTTEAPTTGSVCEDGMQMPGMGAEGSPCTLNADCESETCMKWTDTQTDATCGVRAECGNTRFIGTLTDFDTKEPIPNVELRVVGALAAIQGIESAVDIVKVTSGANGQIDATSATPVNTGIGVIGVVSGGDYYLTATGLAQPYEGSTLYPPLNGIHDIWAVPSAKLTEWSGYLMTDADMAVVDALPLGDNGGVIGLVREGTKGVADAVVVPEKDTSTGIVRYLNEDGMGFNADATSSNGVFVLLSPGIAEKYTVEVAGQATNLWGTAGSAKMASFVLIFNVP
ncbi:hypothetical protein [Nannocystis radixulma]|uniref:Carboxypeptidase regulatory-like domain-containing protein n=1 Tax=Nannocystis radixulma TaxID=2995305 RepID=A0ABT5B9F0_9BACT|nr:hypothetical protein [Nannocystis radixulma]MDC0670722.1 hypothetical protein [Nannocystis radixulma]